MRTIPLLLLILILATAVVCDHAGSIAAMTSNTSVTDMVSAVGDPLPHDIYLYTLGDSAVPAHVLKCPLSYAVINYTEGTDLVANERHNSEVATIQKEPLVYQAGWFSSIKGWLKGESLAGVFSIIALLASGLLGLTYTKAVKTFREIGEFLTALGIALEDNKLSREELTKIIKEGRDIFAVW